MKKLILIVSFCIVCSLSSLSQTLHYFEFTTSCGHGNWQDTSFIAATDDAVVIQNVLTDLAKPYDERRFIIGDIEYGHGGYNHNADHWFLWHFIPGEWDLAEMAIEVCDGCPYSDVDADTAYWIGTLGYFCPWSGKPAREVNSPTSVEVNETFDQLELYPNPGNANSILKYYSKAPQELTLQFFNIEGELISTVFKNRFHEAGVHHQTLPIPENLPSGNYFLVLSSGKEKVSIKLTK